VIPDQNVEKAKKSGNFQPYKLGMGKGGYCVLAGEGSSESENTCDTRMNSHSGEGLCVQNYSHHTMYMYMYIMCQFDSDNHVSLT
jgi:hypothetical protein